VTSPAPTLAAATWTRPAALRPPPFSWADPAWLTALATIGLLVFAVLTALAAFVALAKQSHEVRVLVGQAERDAEDRRRAQAAGVYVVVPGPGHPDSDRMIVRNASAAPVFDLRLFYGPDMRRGPEAPVLLPGEPWTMYADVVTPDTPLRLEFTDATGRRWRTTSRGALAETE
jgi:hypothetical protein